MMLNVNFRLGTVRQWRNRDTAMEAMLGVIC